MITDSLETDPSYIASLKALNYVDRMRLLGDPVRETVIEDSHRLVRCSTWIGFRLWMIRPIWITLSLL